MHILEKYVSQASVPNELEIQMQLKLMATLRC